MFNTIHECQRIIDKYINECVYTYKETSIVNSTTEWSLVSADHVNKLVIDVKQEQANDDTFINIFLVHLNIKGPNFDYATFDYVFLPSVANKLLEALAIKNNKPKWWLDCSRVCKHYDMIAIKTHGGTEALPLFGDCGLLNKFMKALSDLKSYHNKYVNKMDYSDFKDKFSKKWNKFMADNIEIIQKLSNIR